jgi:hypothetical protein
VHAARRARDGVDRAGRQTLRAADATLFIDERDRRRALETIVPVELARLACEQLRQCDDGFSAARRALVDVGSAARDGLGVGQAGVVTTARALRLRQQAIDRYGQRVRHSRLR